jgi:hypothetical protein
MGDRRRFVRRRAGQVELIIVLAILGPLSGG